MVAGFVTFNLVSFAWIFFRANTLEDSYYVVSNLIRMQPVDTLRGLLVSNGKEELSVLAVIMCLMLLNFKMGIAKRLHDIPQYLRYFLYWVIVLGIIFYGKLFSNSIFIYQAF